MYWKILKIWFACAIFGLLKVSQRSDKISHWEEWKVVSQSFWSKSYLLHRYFSRILPTEKTTIFKPRFLGARLPIFMEHLLFIRFTLSEELHFMFYFVGPKSDSIFTNDWFLLKQVCSVFVWILYLDFQTKHLRQFLPKTLKQDKSKLQKTIWWTSNMQHTHWYKEELILRQNSALVVCKSEVTPYLLLLFASLQN